MNWKFLLCAVCLLCCAGCCGQVEKLNPELAYIVGYSLLDERFKTSTRLDLTADILNPSGYDLEMVQLTLYDKLGEKYVLDYQTVGKFSQEGRYNAIPLKKPITENELGGAPGVEYLSPEGLNFLFMDGFERAVLRFRGPDGLEEITIPDLAAITEKSRQETLAWMQKEYEEREQIRQELEQAAQSRLANKKR